MRERILQIICAHYSLTQEQIAKKDQRRQTTEVVNAKQVAAYFLWRFTMMKNIEIAEALGYKDKEIVPMSRKKVKEICKGDHAFKEQLDIIQNQIFRD